MSADPVEPESPAVTTPAGVSAAVEPESGAVADPGPGPAQPEPRPTSVYATWGQRAFYGVVRGAVAGFCRLFWRVEVSGRENIPKYGPFILSPVHRSNVDTPLMACSTRRPLRYMGKDSMWKYRLSAWFFNSMGGIPVRRGSPDREALRTSEAAVRAGDPIVIFPEGTRESGPVIGQIFEGAPFISIRTGVPIIPVGIGGSERAMPKSARMIRPVKVRVIVGAPMYPPPRQEGGRGVRRQVHEMTGRLHDELQRLFDEARAGAG